jgi:hypothetical protein
MTEHGKPHEVGKPVVLRVKSIPSGWNSEKSYDHFFLTVPADAVREMGWKGGDRLFVVVHPGKGIQFVRVPPMPPA